MKNPISTLLNSTVVRLLGGLFLFAAVFAAAPAHADVLLPGDIDTCGELAAPGTYTLIADINAGSAETACFAITSDAVEIDPNGHSITGNISVISGVTWSGTDVSWAGDRTWSFTGAINEGTITGISTFGGGSRNTGTVFGNATFNDTSFNDAGTVNGDITFTAATYDSNDNMYGSANPQQGTVTGSINFLSPTPKNFILHGSASWTDYSTLSWNFVGGNPTWTFYDDSHNDGSLLGTVIFNDNSYNSGGISGTAYFNNFAHNSGGVQTAIFNDSTFSSGTVTEAQFNDEASNRGVVVTAQFYYYSSNDWNGDVQQEANFYEYSSNSGSVSGPTSAFWDASTNYGTTNDTTFYCNASDQGSVSGLSTFNSECRNVYWHSSDGNTDWDNINNWWQDSGFTISAHFAPQTYNRALLYGTTSPIIDLATWSNPIYLDSTQLTGGAYDTGVIITTSQSYASELCNGSGIIGNATFRTTAYFGGCGDPITGNATFEDSSANFGSINGTATFVKSVYTGDAWGGGVPQRGTAGTTIFTAPNVVFNITSGSLSGFDVSNWVFNGTPTWKFIKNVNEQMTNDLTLPGDVYFYGNNINNSGSLLNASSTMYFYDSSQNWYSVVNGTCKFYEDSVQVGECLTNEFHKPFYFNNNADTSWDNLNNWWYDSAFQITAPNIPTNGDVVYFAGTSTSPVDPINLSQIYIASSTTGGGNFQVDLTNLTSSSTITNIYGGWIIGAINGLLNIFSNLTTSTVLGGATVASDIDVSFYDTAHNDSNLTTTGAVEFYGNSYNASNGTIFSAVFNFSSYNLGSLTSGIFNDTSYNAGTSTSATFNDTSYNASTTVTATFNDYSYNAGTSTTSQFNDNSYNRGYVTGTATFNDSSFNGGTTTNALFNDQSKNTMIGLENLVAYYNLNSNLNDSSGNGKNLTQDGSVSDLAGKINNGVRFNNGRLYTSPGAPGFGGTQLTISSWIKTSGSGEYFFVNASTGSNPQGSGYGITVNNGHIVFDIVYGASSWLPSNAYKFLNSISTINDGNWHHIVGTYNQGTLKIYIDGVLDNTSVSSDMRIIGGNQTNRLSLGSNADGTYGRSNGVAYLDEVGIWSKALSDGEVSRLYNRGSGITYPFTNNPGTVLNNATFVGDLSENIYNGVVGIVNGIKTRLYNVLNPQINLVRNFVTDGPWKVVADGVFVNLFNATVNYETGSTTATSFEETNGGFIMKKLSAGSISSCGIIDTAGTYTLSANISNYNYNPCFIVTTDNVVIDGNTKTISAHSSSTSQYAVLATSTTPGGSGHSVTIRNLTISNFAYAVNVNGSASSTGNGGNAGTVIIENSVVPGILASGGSAGTGASGGRGGTVTVSTSTTGSIIASGAHAQANGGNGGTVTINNSYGTPLSSTITANGGSSTSCGNGGNSGSIVLTNSTYGTLTASAGSAQTSGCGGGGGSYVSGSVSAPVVTGSYSPGGGSSGANNGSNGAGAQSVSTGSTAPLSFNNGALPRVTLPIGSFAPIDLKDLPTFGGTGKNAFSFVPKIDNFVFSGLPADVVDRLAAYPSADIYLKSLGLKTAQDLINIRLRPLNLKGEMPEGLFMLRVNGKAVNTSLTGDKSAKAFQLAQATLGDEVTVRLNVSEDVKGAISGKFNGQTVTFSRQGSVAEARLVLPEKAGRYMLTSNRAAFGLAIDFANAPTKAVTSPDAKPKGGIIRWLSSLGSGILSLIRK